MGKSSQNMEVRKERSLHEGQEKTFWRSCISSPAWPVYPLPPPCMACLSSPSPLHGLSILFLPLHGLSIPLPPPNRVCLSSRSSLHGLSILFLPLHGLFIFPLSLSLVKAGRWFGWGGWVGWEGWGLGEGPVWPNWEREPPGLHGFQAGGYTPPHPPPPHTPHPHTPHPHTPAFEKSTQIPDWQYTVKKIINISMIIHW